MASVINPEQRLQLALSLVQKVRWDMLTTEQVQVGIRDEVGAETTAFIQNGFHVVVGDFFRKMEDVAVEIPALARPTLEELREKFSWIREENGIELDNSPTEAITLSLGTVLRPDEERIDGDEYARRRILIPTLGHQQATWLVANQDKPELVAFKALCGKAYIDFPALIVVSAGGNRLFAYLDGYGGRWFLRWDRVGNGLGQVGRVASARKQ